MRARPTFLLSAAAVLLLAACEPPLPDSSSVVQGPAFDSPARIAERERQRQADALLREPMPAPTILPPDAPPGTLITEGNAIEPPMSEAERLAMETRGALGLPPPNPAVGDDPFGAPAPLPGAAGPEDLGLDRDNPEISREQDFDAVSDQRSIEDDAARVNAARAQRIEVQPERLERPDDLGANIISYALEGARPIGAAGTYRRGITASQRAAERRCAGYSNANTAQEEFLNSGGPQRDRLGLDPDGDGNACSWDPAAFRRLLN